MNAYTELIDKYLNNELSDADRKKFEEQLQSNPALKAEYDLQTHVVEGVQQMGMKNEIKRSFKKTKLTKLITKAVVGATIAVALTATGYFVKKQMDRSQGPLQYESTSETKNTPQSVKQDTSTALTKEEWTNPENALPTQILRINPLRDTVVESQGGILFAIPAGTFMHRSGKAEKKHIDLEIKEALTPLDIMKAGLSTLSDGQMLETGGMFYIGAYTGSDSLIIDPKKPIQASVPYNGKRNDMMLFDGKKEKDGSINWVNPVKTVKQLATTDILSLNFYPPHYLDSLKKWGYNVKDKKFTDSLYYSFICSGIEISAPKKEEPVADNVKRLFATDSIIPVTESTVKMTAAKAKITGTAPSSVACGEINPSRIKAIWDKKFNNTLLATHQFEERLQVIFQICDDKILNLYLNNLDKNLYEIDNMAAAICKGDKQKQFLAFAQRQDGGVKVSNDKMKQLQEYAMKKKQIYEEVALKTMQKFMEEEISKNNAAAKIQSAYYLAESIRNTKVFIEEVDLNLSKAYGQLGIPYTRRKRDTSHLYASTAYSAPDTYISAPIISTGWKNVDAYTIIATVSRTTLDFTVKGAGKKAVIHYQPINVTIDKIEDYDRAISYLIPDQLNSFQLMKTTPTGSTENLNELIKYDLIIIGIKGDKIFYAENKNVLPKPYTIGLKQTSEKELEKKLNSSFSLTKQTDLLKDLQYQQFDVKESARQKKIQEREKFKAKVWPIVFPCAEPSADDRDDVFELK